MTKQNGLRSAEDFCSLGLITSITFPPSWGAIGIPSGYGTRTLKRRSQDEPLISGREKGGQESQTEWGFLPGLVPSVLDSPVGVTSVYDIVGSRQEILARVLLLEVGAVSRAPFFGVNLDP